MSGVVTKITAENLSSLGTVEFEASGRGGPGSTSSNEAVVTSSTAESTGSSINYPPTPDLTPDISRGSLVENSSTMSESSVTESIEPSSIPLPPSSSDLSISSTNPQAETLPQPTSIPIPSSSDSSAISLSSQPSLDPASVPLPESRESTSINSEPLSTAQMEIRTSHSENISDSLVSTSPGVEGGVDESSSLCNSILEIGKTVIEWFCS